MKNWEQLKASERAGHKAGASESEDGHSLLDGVPRTLPAMLEAYQLGRRASRIGFDWQDLQGLHQKLQEESRELRGASRAPQRRRSRRIEEEVGDLLFVAVNIARFLGVDPEIALKKANRKFASRFRWMERRAVQQGTVLANVSRRQMEQWWTQAKVKA
jgi:tetrapyrrole methylase family protein/MazG family protein